MTVRKLVLSNSISLDVDLSKLHYVVSGSNGTDTTLTLFFKSDAALRDFSQEIENAVYDRKPIGVKP